jgi:hypothetical protein
MSLPTGLQFHVREPDKRRFLDALNHRDPGEVSYHEMEFSPGHVSVIPGKKITERSYLMPIEDYIETAAGNIVSAMGFDAYHTAVSNDPGFVDGLLDRSEPLARHTIHGYKQRWGDRLTLCGNMDCAGVLSQGTPADAARDTLEHLDTLSVGGGYICGSSHDVDDNMPLENLRAMAETVARYKRPEQQLSAP